MYTHLLLNLMIPELTPWGHTSGSKNPGKPLICSATCTHFFQAWNCLFWIKLGGEGEEGVVWRLHKRLLSEVGAHTGLFDLILNFWLGRNVQREATCCQLAEWKLSVKFCPSWVAILGGRGGFCSALVQYLGAAGHRLANHKHLFSLF